MVLFCRIVCCNKSYRYVTTPSELIAVMTLSKQVLIDKALSVYGRIMICFILSIYSFTWWVNYIAP